MNMSVGRLGFGLESRKAGNAKRLTIVQSV